MRRISTVKQFRGNTTNGKFLLDAAAKKQAIVNQIKSNTKEFTQNTIGKAANIDATAGGHISGAMDLVKSRTKSNSLLSGIIPDAKEFEQVKQHMDGGMADELASYSTSKVRDRLTAAYDIKDNWNSPSLDVMGKNYDLSAMTDKQKNNMIGNLKSSGSSYADSVEHLKKGYMMRDQNFLEKAQTYFSNDSYGTKRKAATGVAVAGLGIANRYSNGGTLTSNEYGERDIIGLPFI